MGNNHFVFGEFPLSPMFYPNNYEDIYRKIYQLGSIHSNQDTKNDSQRVSLMLIVGSTIYRSGKHLQVDNNQLLPRLNNASRPGGTAVEIL